MFGQKPAADHRPGAGRGADHRAGSAHRASRSADPADDRHDRAIAVPQPAARKSASRARGGAAGGPAGASRSAAAAGPAPAAFRPRRAGRPRRRRRHRAGHGRRSDVFDPSQNPNAPGVPRPLGSMPNEPPPIVDGRAAGRRARRPRGRRAARSVDAFAACRAPNPACRRSAAPLPPPPSRNLSATGAVAAVAPPSDSPKDTYDLGYGYVLRKDYALAEDTFQAFLKKYPDRSARRRRAILAGREPVPAPALRRRGAGLPRTLHQARQPRQGAGGAAAARAIAGGDEAEGNGLRHARRGRPQISEAPATREAGRRARTEACPLLTAQPRSRPPKSDRCSPILPIIRCSFSPSRAGPNSTALLVLAARWRKALQARAEACRRHRRSWPARRRRGAKRSP